MRPSAWCHVHALVCMAQPPTLAHCTNVRQYPPLPAAAPSERPWPMLPWAALPWSWLQRREAAIAKCRTPGPTAIHGQRAGMADSFPVRQVHARGHTKDWRQSATNRAALRPTWQSHGSPDGFRLQLRVRAVACNPARMRRRQADFRRSATVRHGIRLVGPGGAAPATAAREGPEDAIRTAAARLPWRGRRPSAALKKPPDAVGGSCRTEFP